MRVVRTIESLGLDRSHTIGLVPTMGSFHEGHLSLMRSAGSGCETLVVSLFVNPTQFGKGEDYELYPRNEERDFAMAESAGVDVMFAPSAEEMYRTQTTTVHVSEITELWEGEIRPGHFDGVTTVVAKLFNIVRPDFAVFGEKDYQQCKVIERMVRDLNMPVRLQFNKTVRGDNGLALSSRNVYLSEESHSLASKLHEELAGLSTRLSRGASDMDIHELLNASTTRLAASGFSVDYLELVDAETLERMRDLNGTARLIGAVRLGKTRLIDNEAVGALTG